MGNSLVNGNPLQVAGHAASHHKEHVAYKTPELKPISLYGRMHYDVLEGACDSIILLFFYQEIRSPTKNSLKSMVSHFQKLFDVPSLSGVYPRMNEVYARLGEMTNAMRNLRDVLQLGRGGVPGTKQSGCSEVVGVDWCHLPALEICSSEKEWRVKDSGKLFGLSSVHNDKSCCQKQTSDHYG